MQHVQRKYHVCKCGKALYQPQAGLVSSSKAHTHKAQSKAHRSMRVLIPYEAHPTKGHYNRFYKISSSIP